MCFGSCGKLRGMVCCLRPRCSRKLPLCVFPSVYVFVAGLLKGGDHLPAVVVIPVDVEDFLSFDRKHALTVSDSILDGLCEGGVRTQTRRIPSNLQIGVNLDTLE